MGCTPTRVDHLDFNRSGSPHEIARFTPVEGGGNVFYIVYSALQSDNTLIQRGGVFLRTWNVDTATLSAVRNVNIDNSGAGRAGSVVKDNRHPHLAQLSTGRLICAYSGNSTNSQGLFIRESTDQGVTWTAEVQKSLGALSSNPHGIQINEIVTDGTDVFIAASGEGGTGAGDLFLFKRTGVGTWQLCKIWDRPASTIDSRFSTDDMRSLVFQKVSSGPDVWKIAQIYQYVDTGPNSNKIVCLYNQAHADVADGTDDTANWTMVTIADHSGETIDAREPMSIAGTDGIIRTIYIRPSTKKVYSADSSNWGQTWNARGILTLPNTKTWDATHNRTSALNSADDWFISTVDGGRDWYAYRNTSVEDASWSLDASCTIDSPFSTEQSAGVGTSIILPSTKLSRLTSDGSGSPTFFREFLTTLTITGPPGATPPPCTIEGSVEVCPDSSTKLCGPEGDGLTYYWTFPDGTTHSTQRCIAASQYGTYTLVVTNEVGGLSTSCSAIVVQPADCPEAASTANRLYRRGIIKLTNSDAPQPGYASTPFELHDRPNWGGD